MQTSEVKQTLKTCEFFKGLGDKEIDDIAGICEVKACDVGDYIFRQGDFGEHMYIIVDGQIFLERSRDLGTRKGNIIIDTLGKGRVLGCWSTMLGEPHILMSSAVCKGPTTVLAVEGAKLRNMMTSNTEFGFNVMEKLCFLLRDRIHSAYGAMEKV